MRDEGRSVEDGQARAAGRGRVVQEFSRAAREAADLPQLRTALCEAVWALGFDYLLVQGQDGSFWLADLPSAWHVSRPVAEGDAVLAAAALSYAPFLWSDIPRLLTLTDAQRDCLSEAVAAGVGAAVSVPIHRPQARQ